MKLRNAILLIAGGITLLSMLVWNRYFIQPASVNSIASEINDNLIREIQLAEDEAQKILAGDTTQWDDLSHAFFVMDSTRVLRWNNNWFLPDPRSAQHNFSLRLLQWPRGSFLLRKWKINSSSFLLAVIPLQNRYKIDNRYLVSGWNKDIFPIQEIHIEDPTVPSDYAFIWNGQHIFNLKIGPVTDTKPFSSFPWAVVILMVGLIAFAVGLLGWLSAKHQAGRHQLVFLILLAVMVGGRALTLLLIPTINLPLFDPSYFASSAYNRSVGDLFINTLSVFVPVAYLFFNYHRFGHVRKVVRAGKGTRYSIVVILFLLCFFSFLFPFLFFETLFHNSTISLDITQSLAWDSVRVFSFLSVVVGCVISYLAIHVFYRIAISLTGWNRKMFYILILTAVALFLTYSLVMERNYFISLIIGMGYLMLLYWLRLPRSLTRITFTTFLYFFVAIFLFALQGTFAIKRFTVEDRLNAQFRFANTFLIDRDYLGEYLLDESAARISADPFIQTRMGSPFLSKAVVRQKVKQVYLNSYFDRYDVQIHLFNSSGDSYDNTTSQTFSELITQFRDEASKTSYEEIFFVKNARSESTKQYLVVIPINRFGVVTGYIVLDLSLKRIIPRNVFPELLLDNRFIEYFKNRNFSYAFYGNGKVVNSFGDFNFEKNFKPILLEDPELYRQGVALAGYLHVGIEDETGRVVVVSSPRYFYFNVITNFSFLFTLGLNLILISLLIYGGITLYARQELNYSARIQIYVYLAFILPLFAVSATTLGLISSSAENQLNEEYIEKSKILGERIAPLINDYRNNPGDAQSELDNKIIELAKLANLDASVFTPEGKLLATSQPLIYEDRILSSLMNREAWEAITREKEISFVSSEKIGTLSYNSSYHALKSPGSGELIGILSLPFFESAYLLEETQIDVLANILVIFCAAFILFSLLSFFAVRWLTFPLDFITKSLRRTTLTRANAPLKWNSNDEIGMMVNEYNRMLENLEQSKIELSRVQKESAWREIAKQVAHEVKNPLTPMKLTLQQMEQAVRAGEVSREKVEKSIRTLLSQVEILNEIAASFSAFARMPAPILEKVELTSLVKKVIDLHSDYKQGEISWKVGHEPVYVMGDAQLLSRVFSNILLNALQSGDEEQQIKVNVEVKCTEEFCEIIFSDNGKGVDPELKDKIFLPHFSTKKSGSGLGLAIAKQGIEQTGGFIDFETRPGLGTTFYIRIPTIR